MDFHARFGYRRGYSGWEEVEMAASFEIKVFAKTISDDPQELKDWIYIVAIEQEKRATQSVDLLGNVVDGNLFLNLPTSDPGVQGATYLDAGVVKVSL